ncbi:hypothetical protein ACLB1Q_30075 [Escherichia coli]
MSGYGIQLINDYGLTVADAEDVNYVCEVPVSSVMVILSPAGTRRRNKSDNNRNEQSFIVSEDESNNSRLTQKTGVNQLFPDFVNPEHIYR